VSSANAPAGQLDTIPRLLARNAKTLASHAANREKEFGIWQSWTWSQVNQEIRSLSMGLIDLGLQPGDHVAIIGRNRPYLYWALVAVECAGAIPVPVYQDSVAEEMHYVLDHCGARFIIAEDQEQVDKVLEIQDRLSELEQMIYLDPRGLRRYDHSKLHIYRDVQRLGMENKAKLEPILNERSAALTSESTAVMLYTSGTTGKPKGDFIFSIGQAYWSGFCVACPESPDTMQDDLREIGPSYFFAPPRYFEGLLTALMVRMEDAGSTKRWLFKTFMDHAKKVGPALMDGQSVGFGDRIKYWIGDKLVYGQAGLRPHPQSHGHDPHPPWLYGRRGDWA